MTGRPQVSRLHGRGLPFVRTNRIQTRNTASHRMAQHSTAQHAHACTPMHSIDRLINACGRARACGRA
jgi:hypothetical protein